MNKAILMGRLVADPDIRYSQGENATCVARYRIAVDRIGKHRDGEQSADFINCVAFGKRGEFAEKYLHKGTKIVIEGHIRTGSYEKDGRTIYTTDIVIDSQEFAESKASSGQTAEPKQTGGDDEFMSIPDGIDEEVPFK